MYNDSKNDGRIILGLSEKVYILKGEEKIEILAKIDTGATHSSIDSRLVKELRLGPIIETKLVKSASGASVRPVIRLNIIIGGKQLQAKFTIADRHHMNYKMLLGQNILKEGRFLIDSCRD